MLPTKWKEHWTIDEPDPHRLRLLDQERDDAKNTIGNLTLITEKLNPSISNGPWDLKCPALEHYSNLRLNAELVQSQSWNEEAIGSRARRLAEIACRIWPRPSGDATFSVSGDDADG